MLIIRFARVGRKNQAYFRLVVAEKSKSAKKKFVEKLGYYNPHTNNGEGEFVFEKDRVVYYISNGAQMSQTAARLLTKAGVKEAGKFVEERASKPKKEEPKEEAPAAEEAPAEEAVEEEKKSEDESSQEESAEADKESEKKEEEATEEKES